MSTATQNDDTSKNTVWAIHPNKVDLTIANNRGFKAVLDPTDFRDLLKRGYPIEWRPVAESDNLAEIPAYRQRKFGKALKIAEKMLRIADSDTLIMYIGGFSNDYANLTLKLRPEVLVCHTPTPPRKNGQSETADEEDEEKVGKYERVEALLLKYGAAPQDFYRLYLEDMELVRICRDSLNAMQERIRLGNRLQRQEHTNFLMLLAHSDYEDLDAKDALDRARDKLLKDSKRYAAMEEHERMCDKAVSAILDKSSLYREIFEDISGIGEKIARRFIAYTGDIRRFVAHPNQELQAHLDKLKVTADDCEKRAGLTDALELLKMEGNPIADEKDYFRKLVRVRDYLKEIPGNEEAAKLLSQAIECRNERGKIKRKFDKKSESRYLAYNGIVPSQKGEDGRRMIPSRKTRRAKERQRHSSILQTTYHLSVTQFMKNRNEQAPWRVAFYKNRERAIENLLKKRRATLEELIAKGEIPAEAADEARAYAEALWAAVLTKDAKEDDEKVALDPSNTPLILPAKKKRGRPAKKAGVSDEEKPSVDWRKLIPALKKGEVFSRTIWTTASQLGKFIFRRWLAWAKAEEKRKAQAAQALLKAN